MRIENRSIELHSRGDADVIDITRAVIEEVGASGITNGLVTIFCPSSTSGLTTLEFEQGCVQDLQRLFDEITNPSRQYAHNARWGDGNGHSHVRSALIA